MKRKLRTVAAAAIFTAASIAAMAAPAHAGRYNFGTDERLYAYAKTGMTHENKPVALCYKTSTYNLFAPIYTTDEKVLCHVESKLYWPLPTGEKLAKLQAAGLMPKPLPEYERPVFDYLMGYILWIVFAGIGAFYGISALVSRGKDNEDTQEHGA